MAAMTPDCVFEDTTPPDGPRRVGAEAVRATWVELFTAALDGVFTGEESLAAGDRVVVRWRYEFGGGHVPRRRRLHRAGGLVAEKPAYVKG